MARETGTVVDANGSYHQGAPGALDGQQTCCRYCDYVSSQVSKVQAHEQTHRPGERIYTCEYCPKRYNFEVMVSYHESYEHRGAVESKMWAK